MLIHTLALIGKSKINPPTRETRMVLVRMSKDVTMNRISLCTEGKVRGIDGPGPNVLAYGPMSARGG